ncbi:hypothetical protein GGI16_000452 [Coemansia sp. S142-1]|nr:hypothetical protein GGI16_000452 [Coemansia sp. S142-1]
MRSNIRLIRDMDQVSSVRELQIVMESGGQPLKGHDYQDPSHPIVLERLTIYSPIAVGHRDLPLVMASTLVHLTLGEICVDWFWSSFVADGAPGSAGGSLVFSCLRSLNLTFPRPPREGGHQGDVTNFEVSRRPEGLIPDSESESRSYTTSSTFGRPQFPVLTTLAVGFFPRNYGRLLSLFAASPITCLFICNSAFNMPSGINLSQFARLRSLEVELSGGLTERSSRHVNEWLSNIFAITGSRLECLDMKLSAVDGFQLRITTPPMFARNITSLKLDDHIAMHDVWLLLPQVPNLMRLEVGPRIQNPISSDSELIRALRNAEKAQQLTPVSTSVKLMRVWRSKYSIDRDQLNPRQSSSAYATFFRTMIVELVCRLPALEILRVAVSPLDGVQDFIQTLVDSGIASEHIGHLQRLQLRSVVD